MSGSNYIVYKKCLESNQDKVTVQEAFKTYYHKGMINSPRSAYTLLTPVEDKTSALSDIRIPKI